jgi:antitoxin VapB
MLPKEPAFNSDDITPKSTDSLYKTFIEGLNEFTDDIFENGRDQGFQDKRDEL